jgi:hypothetical protein
MSNNPLGNVPAREILERGLDLVQHIMQQIEEEGSDLLVVLCNLHDPLGQSVALLNADFKDEAGNDIWAFAIEKDVYKDWMQRLGSPNDALKMKPLAKQVAVFSNGIVHYFSIQGQYSGVPKNAHWARFSRKGFPVKKN